MGWIQIVLVMVAAAGAQKSFNFDADQPGEPKGFESNRTGPGRHGRWLVRAAKDAPSGPNVPAQTDADETDGRFAMAIAPEPIAADVSVSVKCKAIAGKVDQACGLVFRYQDANDYYVTRANALEGNVRFYHVKDGKRSQLSSWSGTVTANQWHELKVDAKGDRFVISWDGKQVLDAKDSTFIKAGKVGVWTKADSITEFDDLIVKEL